jgi:hypothetical protein
LYLGRVLIKELNVLFLIIIYLFVFRNEEFSRPKSVRKAFEGSGQVLGSIAPQVNNSLLSHSCNLLYAIAVPMLRGTPTKKKK